MLVHGRETLKNPRLGLGHLQYREHRNAAVLDLRLAKKAHVDEVRQPQWVKACLVARPACEVRLSRQKGRRGTLGRHRQAAGWTGRCARARA